MRWINEEMLEDLVVGAAVLGAGGGGDPYIGKLLAREAIREYGPMKIVDVNEVPDDALVVSCAMIGAPSVLVEKLPRADEAVRCIEVLQSYLGRQITHTVSIEAGGLNSVTPFAVAGRLGIPIVDADGMGRAFPAVEMVTPTIYGKLASPLSLVDERGNTVFIEAVTNEWAENLARVCTVAMGCSALLASYPLTGHELKETMVAGTLSLAEDLGRVLRLTRASGGNPIQALLSRQHGFLLIEGKITDVQRKTERGWTLGEARIEGSGQYADSVLVLHFQNEHLIAMRDDQVAASVPDLIMALDQETGEPVTTEELRYGFRVSVIAMPCDLRWRTKKGLALSGPRKFGYDVDYVPIEELVAATVMAECGRQGALNVHER